jgi:hypothetical protein
VAITHDDASVTLRMIDEATQRSATLRGYQSAAPHLILWGGIYAAAYVAAWFRPDLSMLVWLIFVPAGVVGDAMISRRDRSNVNWRLFAGLFVTLFAISATAAIMRPHDPNQMAALVPLIVATAYVVLGMIFGRRHALIGIALGVLTLFGFFALPSFFMLWMAAVGGGALVTGGLWLRRI